MNNRAYTYSVRSLQNMLRTIQASNGKGQLPAADGYYGKETTAAVEEFQRSHTLPVTGVTDQETWDEIVLQYHKAQAETTPAQALRVTLGTGNSIKKGDTLPCVSIAQCLLRELSKHFHCLCSPEINGTLDEVTAVSLQDFQEICGLPVTGCLDKETWKHLALQFGCACHIEE